MARESNPGHHTPRPIQRLCRAAATENHEIVGVIYPQSTWVWVWDSTTNTLLDQSNCGGTLCTKLIPGGISGAIVNPIHNSLWIYEAAV